MDEKKVTSSTLPGAHDLSSIVLRTNEAARNSDGWAEVVSWEPRAIIYHNFLSEEECKHLISLAKPHMSRSKVADSLTGMGKESSARTSTGAFLQRGQDNTVQSIEKRIADFTLIPVEHGEGLQVICYEVGQKFEPHHDYSSNGYNTYNGGQRMATVLMYLSDVEEGGETVFPKAKGNINSAVSVNISANKGLSVKPKMRDALLFWSMTPDATLDPLSLHGGSPVIKGNKWASTKWIHVNPFNDYNSMWPPKNGSKVSKRGVIRTCSICKAIGHNKRKCPRKEEGTSYVNTKSLLRPRRKKTVNEGMDVDPRNLQVMDESLKMSNEKPRRREDVVILD